MCFSVYVGETKREKERKQLTFRKNEMAISLSLFIRREIKWNERWTKVFNMSSASEQSVPSVWAIFTANANDITMTQATVV